MKSLLALALVALPAAATPARADPPEIVAARAQPGSAGWSFSVTLAHPDSGWDHYADGWEVLAPDGSRLGLRELLHPHVDEQPFTRSLAGVAIPEGLSQVTIRARCTRPRLSAAAARPAGSAAHPRGAIAALRAARRPRSGKRPAAGTPRPAQAA
jgi:hypothetical protein